MTWNDGQACHAADLAASIYARGIEEAPGHFASARAEYRQISREWHSWLGFAFYLGRRASTYEPLRGVKRKVLEEVPDVMSRRAPELVAALGRADVCNFQPVRHQFP